MKYVVQKRVLFGNIIETEPVCTRWSEFWIQYWTIFIATSEVLFRFPTVTLMLFVAIVASSTSTWNRCLWIYKWCNLFSKCYKSYVHECAVLNLMKLYYFLNKITVDFLLNWLLWKGSILIEHAFFFILKIVSYSSMHQLIYQKNINFPQLLIFTQYTNWWFF